MDSVLFVIGGFLAGFGFYKYILMPRVFEFVIIGLAGRKIVMRIDDKDYVVKVNEA